MPRLKTRRSQEDEYVRKIKVDEINIDLLNCYNKLLKGENINLLIRDHTKLITKMEFIGKNKNKYKSLNILQHYKNTKNKSLAIMVLANTLNNQSLFDKFLSEEERNEKRWKYKGAGFLI